MSYPAAMELAELKERLGLAQDATDEDVIRAAEVAIGADDLDDEEPAEPD